MILKDKRLTKRSINALETKNDIFKSALLLFSKYGYDSVTVQDITKHAGVSKGSFYTHFESKESVFVELFHRIDSHYIETFKKVSPKESAENKLHIIFYAMSEYIYNVCGIDAIKVLYASQISTSKHVTILNNKSRPFYSLLNEIVVQGQDSGEFRNDIKNDELVEFIAKSARGLVYDWCLYNNSYNLIAETEKHLNYILYVLKNK